MCDLEELKYNKISVSLSAIINIIISHFKSCIRKILYISAISLQDKLRNENKEQKIT